MGMFYEQEITVVLPVNQPASNKVLLHAVTPRALHALFSSVGRCREMKARLDATFGHVTELQIWL